MASAPLPRDDLDRLQADLDRASRGGLFELLQFLERAIADAPAIGQRGDPAGERIRLRPSISMDFPNADVESIELTEEDRVLITTTFGGLVGVGSPLPLDYADRISKIRDDRAAERVRGFLDVFHHRVLSLLFQAWKRQLLDPGDPEAGVVRSMLSLGGVYQDNTAAHLVQHTAQAQVQMYHGRTAAGLERLLRRELGYEVRLRPLSKRMARLPPEEQWSLGQNRGLLGRTFVVGEWVRDRNRIDLLVDAEDQEQVAALSPTGDDFAKIKTLVHRYLRTPLEARLLISANREALKPWRLGDDAALGENLWLGEPPQVQLEFPVLES